MSQSVFDRIASGQIDTICVDFDDTACIHRKPVDWSDEATRVQRFNSCINGNNNYYIEKYKEGLNTPLPGLKQLLDLAFEHHVTKMLLSYSTTSIYLEAKQKWVEEVIGKCAIQKFIGVCSQDEKIRFLADYQQYIKRIKGQNLQHCNILYLEDLPKLRAKASKIPHVEVFSPQDVTASWIKMQGIG